MGTVIDVLSFVWKMLSHVLGFMIGIPGVIVNCFIGIGVAIFSLLNNVYSCLDTVYTFFNTAKEYVTAFVESISSSHLWAFLYRMFSLDVMGTLFSNFITLTVIVISLTVFEYFFTALCTAVPFLIYKAIGKIIQAISAGFVKAV